MSKLRELKKLQAGFTLIELLIVVAIIAILVSVGAVAYQTAQQNSRNSQRAADLEKIASALEQWYADHGFYPSTTGTGGGNAWESAGRSTGDHIRCLLGGTYNTTFNKGTKDQDCGFIIPPNTANPPSTNNVPANTYLGDGDPNRIPFDPQYTSIVQIEASYAYASDGLTFALATRHYEGTAPAEHRFTGGEYWSAGSPWDADLKNGRQYIVRSPNHN